MGVKRSVIARLEAGDRPLRFAEFMVLARVLKVSLEALLARVLKCLVVRSRGAPRTPLKCILDRYAPGATLDTGCAVGAISRCGRASPPRASGSGISH
jgi:hypothetical protein